MEKEKIIIDVLLIEDNIDDIKLIKEYLRDWSFNFHHIDEANTLSEAINFAIKKKYDIILLSLNLPDSKGLDTFYSFKEKVYDVPIIILTASNDTEMAIESIKKGADNYIVKSLYEYSYLGRHIQYAIERFKNLNEKIKMQQLETFQTVAHGLSHDLNNILMAIIGNIFISKMILEKKEQVSEVQEILTDIEDSINDAKSLMYKLMQFSEIDEDESKFIFKCVENIKRIINFTIRGSNCSVEYSLNDLDLNIRFNESKFRQIISNIIINAIQSMPDGGKIYVKTEKVFDPKLNIPIQSHTSLEYMKITIKDEGIGMSKESADQAFNIYYTTKKEGTGLGLAISKYLIQKNKGDIQFITEENKGTEFYLYFPIYKDNKKDVGPIDYKNYMGNGEKILIMDDMHKIREICRTMFKKLKYNPTCVSNGTKAITEYKNAFNNDEKYNLVLLDLTVPGKVGGIETFQEIRKIDPLSKIILMSGYLNTNIKNKLRNNEYINGILSKPFNLKELHKKINKCINQDDKVKNINPVIITEDEFV